MDKNRIQGIVERAENRNALASKAKRCKSGGRALKVCVLIWGAQLDPARGTEPSRRELQHSVRSC